MKGRTGYKNILDKRKGQERLHLRFDRTSAAAGLAHILALVYERPE